MKVATIVGARPQFIKAAPVTKALQKAGYQEFLIHTGQHYDHGMSQIFFEELKIPEPNLNLNVGSGSHGQQTGLMLMRLEETLIGLRPDWVLVYGDTNSTLAGALTACKLNIPIAHVEAGLRSFNRTMPEEHNRVLTDHCADLLLCPTQTALDNLAREGVTQGVYWVGDTMYDAILQFAELARQQSTILQTLGVQPGRYLLTTIHRPYNTDVPENLKDILAALVEIDQEIIFPVHPRTRQKISKLVGFSGETGKLKMIEPVGYLDMLVLEQNARLILTDSGGIQKEAYFFGVPCITLRPETEWVETLKDGWNVLTGVNQAAIVNAVQQHQWPTGTPDPIFGTGQAAEMIVHLLQRYNKTNAMSAGPTNGDFKD